MLASSIGLLLFFFSPFTGRAAYTLVIMWRSDPAEEEDRVGEASAAAAAVEVFGNW
jgi:hypothetical protein